MKARNTLVALALGSAALLAPVASHADRYVVVTAPDAAYTPPPVYEPTPAAREGYVWLPGYWQTDRDRRVWIAGRWEPDRRYDNRAEYRDRRYGREEEEHHWWRRHDRDHDD